MSVYSSYITLRTMVVHIYVCMQILYNVYVYKYMCVWTCLPLKFYALHCITLHYINYYNCYSMRWRSFIYAFYGI